MIQTRFVQRLSKPINYGGMGLRDNPFSFGGGLKNGGLSAEAMDLLRPVWTFDYMGDAAYEFGAVPEALSKIFTNPAIVPWGFAVNGTQVYVLSELESAEVEARIRHWATLKGDLTLRDRTFLPEALQDPPPEWLYVRGWLELDNGFLFFTDEEMWKNATKLFTEEAE